MGKCVRRFLEDLGEKMKRPPVPLQPKCRGQLTFPIACPRETGSRAGQDTSKEKVLARKKVVLVKQNCVTEVTSF